MKNVIDFNAAQIILSGICESAVTKQGSSWSFSDLIFKSEKETAMGLMREFKSCHSTPELVRAVGACRGSEVSTQLRAAVVLKIYQTPVKEVEKLGTKIAKEALMIASRGHAVSITPAPNMEAAIASLFESHLKNAKAEQNVAAIELS